MNAHILSIGTELLLGDIVNSNAQFIAKELAAFGIGVYSQSVVGDNEERIMNAYSEAFNKGIDIIVTTGGLGPTADDITKETAAKYFGVEMYEDEKTNNGIKEFFIKQNLPLSENNSKQALVPRDAVIMKNNHGTAPGIIIEKDGKAIIMMPGPPREMEPMWNEHVAPYLSKRQDATMVSRVLRLCGIGESSAAGVVNDMLNNENPTVAPYAKQTECHLRITARAKSKGEADKLIEPIASEIYKRLSDYIYGEGGTSLSVAILSLLKEKNLTIATAESCTGGLLASTLVSAPGISDVLFEGIIVYSNESKMKRLNVKEETLNDYGAVSHETAYEMAYGVAEVSGANIGISTTGIAGPDGGTDDKKVGLVYIGLCINGKTISKEFNIEGDRDRVRTRTVTNALTLLWQELK